MRSCGILAAPPPNVRDIGSPVMGDPEGVCGYGCGVVPPGGGGPLLRPTPGCGVIAIVPAPCGGVCPNAGGGCDRPASGRAAVGGAIDSPGTNVRGRSITSVPCDWPKAIASDSPNSRPDWNRWVGSRCAARAHHALKGSGNQGATAVGMGIGETMILTSKSPSASLSKGRRPVTIW